MWFIRLNRYEISPAKTRDFLKKVKYKRQKIKI